MSLVLSLVAASVVFGIVLVLFEERKAAQWARMRHVKPRRPPHAPPRNPERDEP